MRMRDVYATLRELVPPLTERGGDKVVMGWSDRADPIWRRGSRWVRVEAVTQLQVLLIAGEGDETTMTRTVSLAGDLQPVAREVAQLLGGDA
jgi:hypothetical protein